MKKGEKLELFLLGGYDLEMVEIIKILKQNGKKFEDKKLSWGAKLSDYKEFLNFEGTIYGIELETDIAPPSNYVEIDHHGKNDDKKSSLEQLAEILGIELSKEQKLIAANDSRYISGMKNLCATQKEMDDIRAEDRTSQGITQEDEELAIASINIAGCNKTNIIFSQTPKFSAVSDLAFYKHDKYVIYNFSKVVFYGYKKEKILEFLKSKNISENSYYYGGGDFGFVGIKDEVLNKEEIEKLLEEGKEVGEEELYSYHAFMLPFRFDKIIKPIKNKYDLYKNNDIDKRIKIDATMKDSLLKDGWCHKPFKINSHFDYNEYSYFHNFIRDTLYNQDDFNENATSYFFEKDYRGGKFYLKTKNSTYELDLEGLSLRLFDTGIAIFSIELANRKFTQSDIDSILKINDFGRRIYPPYLGKWDEKCDWTQAPKSSILPQSINIVLPNGQEHKDSFDTYETIPNDIKISKHILELLGENSFTTDIEKKDFYYIQPIIDDRMFVLSWYGDNQFSNSLRCEKYLDEKKWYEYVFVDGDGITVHNEKMRKVLIEKSTYARWMDYPDGLTLFGISRYSFVCLSNASDFSQNVLPLPHVKTMYFQMFTLLLAVRASTLRFSQEVTALSSIKEDDDSLNDNVSMLYKNYIRFVNKLYFREVTAQEQGIEFYDKACEIMKIHENVKDLDAEIAELHSYVDLIEEKKRNDTLTFISKIGAVLLPPSLMAGLFGMNILTLDTTYCNELIGLGLVILSGVFGYIFTSAKKKSKALVLSIILIYLFLLISGYMLADKKSSHNDVNATKKQIEIILPFCTKQNNEQ